MQRKILLAVPVIFAIAIIIWAIPMMQPDQTQSDQTREQTESEQTSDQTQSEQTSDQTESDQTESEQTQIEQTELEYERWEITIENIPLTVEIANDSEKITKGLMFREGLDDDQGMLFIFEEQRIVQFWMMNMKFNLDIMWLDVNGKVVHIVENAEPCIDAAHTSLCTYRPDAPGKYVLEVNSGFVKKHGIDEDSIMQILS
ncbi:MAG: DUF192 domain-containing protein [Nitrososphaerales archaeon]